NSLGATVHLRSPGVHTIAWSAVRAIRRKYLLRGAGREWAGPQARARCRHRPAAVEPAVGRPAISRLDPPRSPALGPHAWTSVLFRGRPARRRGDARDAGPGRPGQRAGARDVATPLSDQARRAPRQVAFPRDPGRTAGGRGIRR